jgi:hypothetical protein
VSIPDSNLVYSEHDWSEWYAPYINARDEGSTPEEAIEAAGLCMEGVR